MLLLPPVEQPDRRTSQLLLRGRRRNGIPRLMRRFRQQFTLPVYLVAAQARDGRLARQFGTQQLPWTLRIHRGHQVANSAFEMHTVAAQAIVHQQPLSVVPYIQEQALVSRAMRPAPPLGKL